MRAMKVTVDNIDKCSVRMDPLLSILSLRTLDPQDG